MDTDDLPEEMLEVLPSLVFAIFNGLAVSWGYDDSSQEEPVLDLLKTFAGLLPALRGVL